ncbi:UNVERIFIED_CONTAM: hypothetical protein PYX00_001748 [Menopon gallinae]|uniref:Uncharacterized protein n=1 Tax=Menopon gallinae TaxID=328185 RepID=A0AAW2IEA2_9NEOP
MSEMERKRAEAEKILGPRTELQKSPKPGSCEEKAKSMDIKCKNAMVVGGASGIGFETAHELIRAGVKKVCVVDNQQNKAVAAVQKLNSGTDEPKAFPVVADVRSDCAYDMAFREMIRCFGQLDIVVNCVGVYDETPECWDQMVRLNLIGMIRGTILAYHYLSGNTSEDNTQGGVIVNVSSYGAIANVPTMPLYSAAANGINGLTTSFGQEFHFSHSGVRCVTVCPSCVTAGVLSNMQKMHYRPEWAPHSALAMRCKDKQTAKQVARAIVHTIRVGLNGNVYAVLGGKLYRYLMPDYRKITRREAYLL